MNLLRTSLILSIAVLVMGRGATAAPKASVRTNSWQLDVKFHDPQRLSIILPGDRHETSFWYVLYEVTNNTGKDRQFYPSARLVTNTLQVIEGGANISPTVYSVIAGRHKLEFPFLAAPSKVTGLLLQGRANARATVAVFRDFDVDANSFSIYISGFAGEIHRKPNATFKVNQAESPQDNPRYFLLRRTLKILYDFPGDPETRHLTIPIRRSREWVMR